MPHKVRRRNGEFGQIPGRQRLPAPSMAGHSVNGEHLSRLIGAVAMHV